MKADYSKKQSKEQESNFFVKNTVKQNKPTHVIQKKVHRETNDVY